MLLLIVSFIASINDSIGYNYLMEYYPGVVSYHNLYFYGNLRYDFEKSESSREGSSMQMDYYKRYYSLKNDWYLMINPYGSFNREDNENELYAYLRSEGDYKVYPFSAPFFASLGGNFQGWWRNADTSDFRRVSGELEAGIGFGRMIPLSTAYEVLKIEEELSELGNLDKNISKEDLALITDFLRNKGHYLDVREFWRDFENLIKNLEGFNSDRLGAVPTIRIDEIINRGSYTYRMNRDRGYEIRGYTGFKFSKDYGTSPEINYEDFFLGGRFRYSRPISTKLQFRFDLEGETYVSDSIEIKNINISSSLYYEVLKKLYLTLNAGYYNVKDRYYEIKREYFSVSLSPTYYIQYRLSFGLRGTYYYYTSNDYNGETYRGSLSASFRYYLF